MKSVLRFLCVTLASLSLVVACGDDGGGGGGDGSGGGGDLNNTQQVTGPPVSLDQLPDRTKTVFCDQIFDCCTTDERQELTEGGFFDPGGSRAECRNNLDTFVSSQLDALQDAVAAGTVTYHADKAGNCIAWMEAQECSDGIFMEGQDQQSDCDETFEGQVEAGGECNLDEECSQGSCDQEYDEQDNPVGPGTCTGGGGENGGCDWDDDCNDGEYCNSSYDSETEEWNGTCETIGQIGDTCSNNQGCEEDLYCDSEYDPDAGESVGTCKEKGDVGDTCDFGGCLDHAYCESTWDEDTGEQVSVCVEKGSVGDPCEQSGQCDASSYCDTSEDAMTCVARKAEGEPCENYQECQEDAWCGSVGDDPEAQSVCQSSGGTSEDMCTGT